MEFTPVRPNTFSFNCNIESVQLQVDGVVLNSATEEIQKIRDTFESVHDKLHNERAERFSSVAQSVFDVMSTDVSTEEEQQILPDATFERITQLNDQLWAHIYERTLSSPLMSTDDVDISIQIAPSIAFLTENVTFDTDDEFIEAPLSPNKKLLIEPEYDVSQITQDAEYISIDFISDILDEHKQVLVDRGFSERTLSGFSEAHTERQYFSSPVKESMLYENQPELAGHITTVNSSSHPVETSIDIIAQENELSGRTGFLLYLLLADSLDASLLSYRDMNPALVSTIIDNTPHLDCAGIPQVGKLLIYNTDSCSISEQTLQAFEEQFPEKQELDEIETKQIRQLINAPQNAILDERKVETGKRYEKLFELLSTQQATPYSVLYFICAPFDTTEAKQQNLHRIISYGDDLIQSGLQADSNHARTITSDFISDWPKDELFGS